MVHIPIFPEFNFSQKIAPSLCIIDEIGNYIISEVCKG
nr:MAG TPA: Protein of unknown function (DUF2478) [Caudoviricetes sp.]